MVMRAWSGVSSCSTSLIRSSQLQSSHKGRFQFKSNKSIFRTTYSKDLKETISMTEDLITKKYLVRYLFQDTSNS